MRAARRLVEGTDDVVSDVPPIRSLSLSLSLSLSRSLSRSLRFASPRVRPLAGGGNTLHTGCCCCTRLLRSRSFAIPKAGGKREEKRAPARRNERSERKKSGPRGIDRERNTLCVCVCCTRLHRRSAAFPPRCSNLHPTTGAAAAAAVATAAAIATQVATELDGNIITSESRARNKERREVERGCRLPCREIGNSARNRGWAGVDATLPLRSAERG